MIVFFLMSIIIPLVASFLVALFTYTKLVRNANKYPWFFSIAVFLLCFLVTGAGMFFLMLYNLDYEPAFCG